MYELRRTLATGSSQGYQQAQQLEKPMSVAVEVKATCSATAAYPHKGSRSYLAEMISALITNLIRKMIRGVVFFSEL